MIKILRRKDINLMAGIIQSLAFSDSKYMDEEAPDEALTDIESVLNNSRLQGRCKFILDMVDCSGYDSIFSRRLYQDDNIGLEIYDLMNLIDVTIAKVVDIENEEKQTKLF